MHEGRDLHTPRAGWTSRAGREAIFCVPGRSGPPARSDCRPPARSNRRKGGPLMGQEWHSADFRVLKRTPRPSPDSSPDKVCLKGLSGELSGELLGPPKMPADQVMRRSSPRTAPPLANLPSQLDPILDSFSPPFWISNLVRSLEPSWSVTWYPKLLRRRKTVARGHHKVAFLLLCARVSACRLSGFFEASWGPVGALVVPIWPRGHDFWVPQGLRNDHQNRSKIGPRQKGAPGRRGSEFRSHLWPKRPAAGPEL